MFAESTSKILQSAHHISSQAHDFLFWSYNFLLASSYYWIVWIVYLSLISIKYAIDRYEPVLVQEMLTLLIQIVKERRFCGQSAAESLRRELVYKLATGDATRSQLVKALPRDLAKFSKLQEVLDMVALYLNPSDYNQVGIIPLSITLFF